MKFHPLFRSKQPLALAKPAPTGARRLSLLRDERGMSTVEYVILMVVIVVGAIGIWKNIGAEVRTGLEESKKEFNKLNLPAK